jgi:hypothetical protein
MERREELNAPDESSNRARSRSASESEISFPFNPRIPAGEYLAYCRSATIYRDRQFKRWVCAAQFDVFDGSLLMLAGLTWYLNLGSREKPHTGRRGNFWAAWCLANGGPPKRNDRMSARIFERRYAVVRVSDTAKTYNASPLVPEESYSVVRNVIDWQSGGAPRWKMQR